MRQARIVQRPPLGRQVLLVQPQDQRAQALRHLEEDATTGRDAGAVASTKAGPKEASTGRLLCSWCTSPARDLCHLLCVSVSQLILCPCSVCLPHTALVATGSSITRRTMGAVPHVGGHIMMYFIPRDASCWPPHIKPTGWPTGHSCFQKRRAGTEPWSKAGIPTWEAGCASPYQGTCTLRASPQAAWGASSTSCSAVTALGGVPMPARCDRHTRLTLSVSATGCDGRGFLTGNSRTVSLEWLQCAALSLRCCHTSPKHREEKTGHGRAAAPHQAARCPRLAGRGRCRCQPGRAAAAALF